MMSRDAEQMIKGEDADETFVFWKFNFWVIMHKRETIWWPRIKFLEIKDLVKKWYGGKSQGNTERINFDFGW